MRAGFAAVDLRPPLGLALSGYGYYLDRRARQVMDPIMARALVLDDGRS